MAEQESKDSGGAAVAEQVLSIMENILDESNAEPLSEDKVCVGKRVPTGLSLSLTGEWVWGLWTLRWEGSQELEALWPYVAS